MESLKHELELIQENMLQMLHECKSSLSLSIDLEFKLKQQESALVPKNEGSNAFEDFMQDLKSLKENFDQQLKRFSVEISEWLPSSHHIAAINGCGDLILKAKHIVPEMFDLSNFIQNASSICQLKDESYVLVSAEDNSIVNINKDLQSMIKKSNSIGGRHLNKPTAVCTGYSNLIYICDCGNNRIIIANDDLESVKKVFGKKGVDEGEFDEPIDLAFSDEALFVLEKKAKRIQKFSRMGEFLECFNLVSERCLKSFQVTSDEFIILSENCVQIIDKHSGAVQELSGFFNNGNFLYIDGVLAFYDTGGNIKFYEKFEENFLLKEQRNLHQLIARNIQKAYAFKNNFIVVLMDRKLAKF